MEVTGKIIKVLPITSGVSAKTGNTWHRQEAVIEVPSVGNYTRKMVFTIFGEDKIAKFDVHEGMQATVQFDIDAKEYNGSWYNSITAYNVINLGQGVQQTAQQPQAPAPQQPSYHQPDMYANAQDDSADDLPF